MAIEERCSREKFQFHSGRFSEGQGDNCIIVDCNAEKENEGKNKTEKFCFIVCKENFINA